MTEPAPPIAPLAPRRPPIVVLRKWFRRRDWPPRIARAIEVTVPVPVAVAYVGPALVLCLGDASLGLHLAVHRVHRVPRLLLLLVPLHKRFDLLVAQRWRRANLTAR